ncbi:MAG: site-2 protease family protein [Anaerolineae bacterium]
MGWSIKLGRVFGINIQVHFTFFLILIWGALNFGGQAGPAYGLLVTVALFTLVLLHELGHSLAAMAYGIPVRDITLLPFGGVARLERMPEKPLQEFVVALAGPAVNVVLAIALAPIVLGLAAVQAEPLALISMRSQGGLPGLLSFLLIANVSLALFNLLPAFPMDGGRIFRAGLGLFLDFPRATSLAVTVGRMLAVGLGIFGVFMGQFFLALIALFIFTASGQERAAVNARNLLREVRVGQALDRDAFTLSPNATIGQVASIVLGGDRPDFAVVDPYSRQLLGVISRRDVARAMEGARWYSLLSDVMRPAVYVPRVTSNTPLSELGDTLARTPSQVAAVYDGPFFQGLISLDDAHRVLRFLSRRGPAAGRFAWEIR